ncbi:hypothetical protein ACOJQI_08745 [Bacillus salacetis]|uniref:hypothetical protein n=1 Tax=Bacillus salacetis TaxID=2315464 RepID=UPI003B9F2941
MIYRVKMYEIIPEKFELFNEFFHEYLYPNQVQHGSKLVGRWVDLSKTKITAIWEYETIEQYGQIEMEIRMTELHIRAKKRKKKIEPLFFTSTQEFWEMTGEYSMKENPE